ncbi:transporter [Ganoderma sinense ZZ0214-1]|uniref:laccase n=1 Tax=Ganoderma sinense ZZ0214-1 TaxID=1077348 RepID=A0A2G8SRH3_9APHY|nr:transporter [Ganoderma sinense ZZ0214-1]
MSRGSPSKLLSLSFTAALAVTATAASLDLSTSGISIDVATQASNVAELIISNANVAPDGYTRAAIVVNGQSPGPLLSGNKGDRFSVNVVDQLTNSTMLKSTSMHFHGVDQIGTNWEDGAAFVNQCPISTGHSFNYEFACLDQAGTFWYHSHLSTQYCDGLRGPMVVYDPNDPHADLYDVDDESTIITLADWYHTATRINTRIRFGADAVLINGLGRYAGGPSTPLAVISVTQGKRYRFRLVSMACDPNFTFSIDGHTMTVIEVDAVNHEPLAVDSIQIFAGQRYSFVLAASQPVDNYWVRALPSSGTTTFAGGMNSAVLRYLGAPPTEPAPTSAQANSTSTDTAPLVETALVPLDHAAAPGEPTVGGVDYALNLVMSFDGTKFLMNGAAFSAPSMPVLLQILSGASSAADLLPSGSVYVLPSNATVELSFPVTDVNRVGAPHPFHLHGHTFSVVRSAGSATYNYANPPRRDVVNTGNAGDNVTIRFRTDNPGPWFLHCHIDPHADAGLGVVLAVGTNATAKFKPSAAWDDLCPAYNSLSSDDL